MDETHKWQKKIEAKAYPVEAPKKKVKTKKDKGSKYPGTEQLANEGKDVNVSEATAEDVGTSASEAMEKLHVQ